MQIKTKLVLYGASAVIATALVFACRPVLIGALEAMRDPGLSIGRAIFIGLWAFAVVVAILRLVSDAAVAISAANDEPKPPEEISQPDRVGKLPNEKATAPALKDDKLKADRPKIASRNLMFRRMRTGSR